MPLITIDNVHKHFGTNHVLKGVSLSIEAGEVIAVIGKSGSGKSTLLRCVNGLETLSEGSITVDEVPVSAHETHLRELRLKVGMIFQQFNLFPHLSAGRNVMLSQQVVKKTATDEAQRIARDMLGRVGLAEKFDAMPDQLSVDSSSAWPSRGRWRCSRVRCCATRSPRRSTRNWSTRCSLSCARWPMPA